MSRILSPFLTLVGVSLLAGALLRLGKVIYASTLTPEMSLLTSISLGVSACAAALCGVAASGSLRSRRTD
mgnify:CR=1 FL=1